MTITNENAAVVGLGNGVNTTWSFGFLIPEVDGLAAVRVFIADTTTTVPTSVELDAADYTIIGLDDPDGGVVTYPKVGSSDSPLALGHNIAILRDAPYEQIADFLANAFSPPTVEVMGDVLEEQIQQLLYWLTRVLTVPFGSNMTPEDYVRALIGTPGEGESVDFPIIRTTDNPQTILNNNAGKIIWLMPGRHFYDNHSLSVAAGAPVELLIPSNTILMGMPGAEMVFSSPVCGGFGFENVNNSAIIGVSQTYDGPNSQIAAIYDERPDTAWTAAQSAFLIWAPLFLAADAKVDAGNPNTQNFSTWWAANYPGTRASPGGGSTNATARHSGIISFDSNHIRILDCFSTNWNAVAKNYGPSADDGSMNVDVKILRCRGKHCDMGTQNSRTTGGEVDNSNVKDRTNKQSQAENHDMYGVGNDNFVEPSYNMTYNCIGSFLDLGDVQTFGHFYKIRYSIGFTVSESSGYGGCGFFSITEHASGTINLGAYADFHIAYIPSGSVPRIAYDNQGDKFLFDIGNDASVNFSGTATLIGRASTASEPQEKMTLLGVTHGGQARYGQFYLTCSLQTDGNELCNADGWGEDNLPSCISNIRVFYNDTNAKHRLVLLAKNGASNSRVLLDKLNASNTPYMTVADLGHDNVVIGSIRDLPHSFDLTNACMNTGKGARNAFIPLDIKKPMIYTSASVNLNARASGWIYFPDTAVIANGDTYTNGGTVYTWNTVLGGANSILIEATVQLTLANALTAVTSGASAGKVGAGTVANVNVGVFVESGTKGSRLSDYAKSQDALVGNAIAHSTTVVGATSSGATLTGGGYPDDDPAAGGANCDTRAGAITITLPRYPHGGYRKHIRKADTSANTVIIQDATPTTLITLAAGAVHEAALQWYTFRVPYTSGGTYEVKIGDTITGATSAATGVVEGVSIKSGTLAAGTAAGDIILKGSPTGTFAAENLNVGGNLDVATIAQAPLGGWQPETLY